MPPISKKFNQFKQWTGEKFGSSEKTETSEEYKKLKSETEERMEHYQKVNDAVDGYTASMAKRKEGLMGGDKKSSPLELMGSRMVAFGSSVPTGCGYGQALMQFGETQEKIAHFQIDYITYIKDSLSQSLLELLRESEEYSQLKKKLANRRLDYDAKLTKLKNAKKEKPELEEESRVSQLKYEESLGMITHKMMCLTSVDDEQIGELEGVVDEALVYHEKALEALLKLKAGLKLNAEGGGRDVDTLKAVSYSRGGQGDSKRVSRQGSQESLKGKLASSQSYQPSAVGYGMSSQSASVNGMSRSTSQLPSTDKFVSVLFDFNAENPVKQGDVVQVLEEVDENWSSGQTVKDSRRGIFPRSVCGRPKPAGSPRVPFANTPPLTSTIPYTSPHPRQTSLNSLTTSQTTAPVPAPRVLSGSQPPQYQSLTGGAQMQAGIGNGLPQGGVSVGGGNVGTCGVCGCKDYSANVFKKGQCNNCFHSH